MKHDVIDNNLNSLTLDEAISRLRSTKSADVRIRLRVKLQLVYGKLVSMYRTTEKQLVNPRIRRCFNEAAAAGHARVKADAQRIADALNSK